MTLFLQQALQLPQLHQQLLQQVSLRNIVICCVYSPGLFIIMLLEGHCACSDQGWLDVEASSWRPTSGTR